jgi:two-component system, cell cycle response regulator
MRDSWTPSLRVLIGSAAAIGGLVVLHAVLGGRHAVAQQIAISVLLAASCVVVAAGTAWRHEGRRGWKAITVALFINNVCNATVGWNAIAPSGALELGSAVLSIATLPLVLVALRFFLLDRGTRLPAAALLDGMTGSLVLQATIALVFIAPVEGALLHLGPQALALLAYPLSDLLMVGLIGAVAAHGGWRFDAWAIFLAALVTFTIADVHEVAASAGGHHVVAGISDFGWISAAFLLAVGAWSPPPRRGDVQVMRGWVAAALGCAGLALLVGNSLSGHPSRAAMILASCGLSVMVARLALTLHENAAILARAQRDAVTDGLTGLGNRRQLIADLEQAVEEARPDAPFALGLFDLNGFKDYNDTYGHQAGDALLVELGRQLSAAVHGTGEAYRMGGDEFCILLATSWDDARAIADRASAALRVGSTGIAVSAAHGLVLVPQEAATAGEALRLADLRMYEDKTGRRIGSSRQVATTLMVALEERDRRLQAHGAEVEALAGRVAERLGLTPTEVEAVRLAAGLHDVGKLAIPDRILEKTEPLDDAERDFLRRHSTIGERIVRGAPALRDIAPLIRSSHERVDGEGYPDGLRGEEIPLGARIVAVCDAFVAMISPRYGDARTPEAALAELRHCAGTQFDADVVAAFAHELAGAASAARQAV